MRRLVAGLWVTCLAASLAASAAEPSSPAIPELSPESSVVLRGPELEGMRSIMDYDVLADGRIAVLDFDSRSVAIVGKGGDVERILSPLDGIPTPEGRLSRLLARPDGWLVLADSNGNRFFFYDDGLELRTVVPFEFEVHSLSGFVRHGSGDLFVTGYSPKNDRILHRFDKFGRHIDSYIPALPGGYLEKHVRIIVVSHRLNNGACPALRIIRFENS